MDRFELYELCTQTPADDVRRLRTIHGRAARVLGEDFAGTAALSRAWVRAIRGGRAIAVDRDPEPLRRARAPGVTVRCADVLDVAARVDVIATLNFSVCELHERRELLRYLEHARRRLRPGGILAADLYGGAGAFRTGCLRDSRRGPRGERVTYEFEQSAADALTARVVDALHFTVRPGGAGRGGTTRLRDAFVYDWRLWSPPELRDAMLDAGFGRVEFWPRAEHAIGPRGRFEVRPLAAGAGLGEDYCVLVVGRRDAGGPFRRLPERSPDRPEGFRALTRESAAATRAPPAARPDRAR